MSGQRVMHRDKAKDTVLDAVNGAKRRVADPDDIRQHRGEYWFEIAGRLDTTPSTSDVAVCCSRASVSSRSRAPTRARRSREVADCARVERLAMALFARDFLAVLPARRMGRFMSAPRLRTEHRIGSNCYFDRG